MDRKNNKKIIRTPHWPSYARGIKREAKKLADSGVYDFSHLIDKAVGIKDPYYSAQSLAWIGRKMAAVGLNSDGVFSKAIESSKSVEREWRRSEILCIIAAEMSKSGEINIPPLVSAINTISDMEHRQEAVKTLKRLVIRGGMKLPDILKVSNQDTIDLRKKTAAQKPKSISKTSLSGVGRSTVTLGLFNTYAGKKLKDIHMRAVARAASLCYAFELNLGLFNFPLSDTSELIRVVEGETQIEQAKRSLRFLYENGRIIVAAAPKKPISPDIGLFISATAHPDSKKETTLHNISKKNASFCVLIGLGSKGLPKNVLNLTKHHVELTGKNISLETCTAMGVLAANLHPILVK